MRSLHSLIDRDWPGHPLAPLPHLALRLVGGSRRAGWSFRRAGCFYPSLPDTVQNSITIGFCRSRTLWVRLALTCGEGQASRPQELNCGNQSMPLRITRWPVGRGLRTRKNTKLFRG